MKTFKQIINEDSIPSQIRSRVNADLVKAGLDGNKPYTKISEALKDIATVFNKQGIEISDSLDANLFRPDPQGKSINRRFHIAFSNAEDSFSPIDISNSLLVISFAQLSSNRLEVLAYLS